MLLKLLQSHLSFHKLYLKLQFLPQSQLLYQPPLLLLHCFDLTTICSPSSSVRLSTNCSSITLSSTSPFDLTSSHIDSNRLASSCFGHNRTSCIGTSTSSYYATISIDPTSGSCSCCNSSTSSCITSTCSYITSTCSCLTSACSCGLSSNSNRCPN